MQEGQQNNSQQATGQQGAIFVDPMFPASQQPLPAPAQQAAPTSRATFNSELNPGAVIPANPNAPIQNSGAGKTVINPNSTQNTLQIAEIRDGIVIMNDGSFRSVVMVKPINFDLMSAQEREGVEYSFQSLLNSLYFDIQIFVRSQKVDIRPYIEKLDKIRSEHDNMLLAMLMDDYIGYIDALASQTNIMDKHFYIVIPFSPKTESQKQKPIPTKSNLLDGIFGSFNKGPTHIVITEPDLEEAKAELRNRVQATLGGLLQCGVQGVPLDTQELIELYYDVYNPDTATRQQLKDFDSMSVPVITKGEGQAPQPNLDREVL